MRHFILLILLLFQLAQAQLSPLCFLPPNIYTNSASGNIDVAADDFNNDGIMDIASIDYLNFKVVMMLGSASGSYNPVPCNCSTGSNPSQILSGDYNNDGKKDVIVVNRGSNDLSVLFGTGTGSFLPQTTYSIGSNSHGMTKNDFNNDGIADIATSNYSSGNISLFMGQSNGVFVPTGSLTTGVGAEAITSGDYNNDGKKDIAITIWTMPLVKFFYGNGNGTFQAPVNCPIFTFNNYPFAIVTADFNNDSYDDVVLQDALSFQVTALFGTPTNTMSAYINIGSSIGTSFARISAGDLNADGNIDVVTPKGNIFLSNGTGSFVSVNSHTIAGTMVSVVIKDMNNDSKPDLVFSEAATDVISVALNGPIITSSPLPNYICAGHSLTINAFGANSYTWSAGPISSSISVSPTITTTYSVTGTAINGCTNTANITVTVNINPTAADLAFMTINSTSPTTVCAGSTISVCASGASNYTWSTNSNSACISDVPNITTTYSVIALSNVGCYKNMSYTQIVDACSGIDEIKIAENAMGAYPNPTTNYININNDYTTTLSCLITNTLGKVERVFTINSGKNTIDLMDLKEGIYFFTLMDKGKTLGYTKIVVTK